MIVFTPTEIQALIFALRLANITQSFVDAELEQYEEMLQKLNIGYAKAIDHFLQFADEADRTEILENEQSIIQLNEDILEKEKGKNDTLLSLIKGCRK